MDIKDWIPNFESYSDKELYDILESNADKVNTSDEFTRPLSEGEIKAKNQQIGANRVKIWTIEKKAKDAADNFKEEMKPFKSENTLLIHEVRDGYAREEGSVFQFNDDESQMAYFYNSKGHFVRSRPLRPNERQRTIMAAMRIENDGTTGTDG